MGQDVEALIASGIPVESWEEAEAPARRRRWYDSGAGTLAVLLASSSDVDDLVPTLVAFQIEWNKIRIRMRAAGWPDAPRSPDVPPEECARELGGSADDWARLREAWGEAFGERMRLIAERRLSLRMRMLGGTHTGYARLTRRWWTPVSAKLARNGAHRAPPVLRQLELPQPRQHRHRHRPRARARADRVRRAAERRRHPPPGADGVPRGRERGLVGELPVLRRAPVLQRPRTRGRRRAPRRRAAEGRHPPAQQDGPARPRAGHRARRARSRRARSTARPGRHPGPGRERRGDRQHRLSAGRRRLQHPARGRGRPHRHCEACTSSARPPP